MAGYCAQHFSAARSLPWVPWQLEELSAAPAYPGDYTSARTALGSRWLQSQLFLQPLQLVVLEYPPVWLDLSALIWPFRWMTIIPRVWNTLLHFPDIFGLQRAKRQSQAWARMNQRSSHQRRRAKKAWWQLAEDQDSPSRVSFSSWKHFCQLLILQNVSTYVFLPFSKTWDFGLNF